MVYRITIQPLNDTGLSFVKSGKTKTTYAVGDRFNGSLSETRRRLTHLRLEWGARSYGLATFREEVLEHGQWELISSETY